MLLPVGGLAVAGEAGCARVKRPVEICARRKRTGDMAESDACLFRVELGDGGYLCGGEWFPGPLQ